MINFDKIQDDTFIVLTAKWVGLGHLDVTTVIFLFLCQTKIYLFISSLNSKGNRIQDFKVAESSQYIWCKFICCKYKCCKNSCFCFICGTVPLVFICDYRKCRRLSEPYFLSSEWMSLPISMCGLPHMFFNFPVELSNLILCDCHAMLFH